jgi:hypothetical protein
MSPTLMLSAAAGRAAIAIKNTATPSHSNALSVRMPRLPDGASLRPVAGILADAEGGGNLRVAHRLGPRVMGRKGLQ